MIAVSKFTPAWAILLLCLITAPAIAQDSGGQPPKPHLYGTDWGLTLKADGTGFYNDLVRLAVLKAAPDINYEIQPYRRAKAAFLREQDSCLYPSNIKLLIDGQEIPDETGYLDSMALLRVKVFILSRPGTIPPARARDMNNKSVAYAMGSRVPYFLRRARANFIAVSDETGKAELLLSGRVDMIAAAMPDAKFVFDKLGTALPPFDPGFALNDTQIRVTCHDTPANRLLIDDLNQHITRLHRDESLAAFFRAQGLDPDIYLPDGS